LKEEGTDCDFCWNSYTEKEWNVDSTKHIEEKGLESEGPDSYRASKTLAEQALWSESMGHEYVIKTPLMNV